MKSTISRPLSYYSWTFPLACGCSLKKLLKRNGYWLSTSIFFSQYCDHCLNMLNTGICSKLLVRLTDLSSGQQLEFHSVVYALMLQMIRIYQILFIRQSRVGCNRGITKLPEAFLFDIIHTVCLANLVE